MIKKRTKGKTGNLIVVVATYFFLWLPLIILLIFSFNTVEFPSSWKGATLRWYKELIESPYLWKSFRNSLIVAISSTGLSVLMSIFLFFYAAQGGHIRKYMIFFYGGMIIPETVLGVSLLAFFSLLSVSLGLVTLIVAHTILGLSFVIPIVYARFLELDYRLTEASLVLGATPVQTFFKITLPLLGPSLTTSALLAFIISFDDFILSFFCAGSSVQTLSLYILSMIRTGISPVMNALSAVLILMSSLMALFYFRLSNRGKAFI